MREFAKAFYLSPEWRKCRDAYISSVGGLCERCYKKGRIEPGVIVHHKRMITEDNIGNPDITLNWDNLELVCRDCHADAHRGFERRYKIDEMGRVNAT